MDIRNNEGKLIIWWDFDCTLVNSVYAFCQTYSEIHYNDIFKYKTINFPQWQNVKKWSFKDEIPYVTTKELREIFESDRFFEILPFYADSNGITMGDLFHELYHDNRLDNRICSKGTSTNIIQKKLWIKKNMPYFDLNKFKGMPSDIMDNMEKSEIFGFLLTDDHHDNILTANTKHKLLFSYGGIVTDWNDKIMNDINAPKAFTVNEVANKIIELIEFELIR